MADDKHLPYEEEAHVITEVMEFLFHRLPHSISETIEHLDEAQLTRTLVEDLEAKPDDELKAMRIHRDDIPEIAAGISNLFHVAKRRKKST